MPSQSNVNKYYGLGSVSASLKHFLLGKGFKIVSSLAILVILARYLEKDEYAAYISFQAIAVVLGLISSFGIQAVLFRYIPELRASGNNISMYKMLAWGVSLRGLAMLAVVIITILLIHWVAEVFNLAGWEWLLTIYLFVGMANRLVLSLSQSLESLLWQKEAQYSLAIGSMCRFLLLLMLIFTWEADLVKAIAIEAFAEIVALTLLLVWGRKRWKLDEHRSEGDTIWLQENKARVVKYGAWGFLMNQTNVLYGSAPNRLLTAHYLGPVELGILGFADTLTNLARRFMPTRLLIGFIRPVFMARYSASGDIQQLVDMSNMIYRFNLLILVLPIALLAVSGSYVFDWITAGKYAEAGLLLAGFLVLMVTESMRSLLELVVLAIEKNHISVMTNVIQSMSLFMAIPLFSKFGVWSLVISNITGTVIANLMVIVWLEKYGHKFRLDKMLVAQILAYGLIAGVSGYYIKDYLNSEIIAMITIVSVYLILCAIKLPFEKTEMALMKKIVSKKAMKQEAV